MNFFMQFDAQFLNLFQIGRMVGVAANAFVFDDKRFDLLVPEYGADPAAPCLLEPLAFSSFIIVS
jgi:hypothetical protein